MRKRFRQLLLLAAAGLWMIPALLVAQEYGDASYYSDDLHGERTASGERYNKYGFTAAHRDLEFGTMVRITNLDNRRSVSVKINDRGPYKQGRIVDLSRAAAEQIGLTTKGVARVQLEILSTPSGGRPVATGSNDAPFSPQPTDLGNYDPNIPLDELPLRDQNGNLISEKESTGSNLTGLSDVNDTNSGVSEEIAKYTPSLFQMAATKQDPFGYGVQVSAFDTYYRMLEGLNDLHRKGFDNTMVQNGIKDGKPIFRIILGPYQTKQQANDMKKKANAAGQKGYVVDLATLN